MGRASERQRSRRSPRGREVRQLHTRQASRPLAACPEPDGAGTGGTTWGSLRDQTSRSVSTTQVGERLLRTIAPHFQGIEGGLANFADMLDRPARLMRLTAGDQPAEKIVLPAASKLLPNCRDQSVEIISNAGFVKIVAERFDAGVRLGETVAKDMVAIPTGPDMRMAVEGSPGYFSNRQRPMTPHDLEERSCIKLRYTTDSGWAVWTSKGTDVPSACGLRASCWSIPSHWHVSVCWTEWTCLSCRELY